MNTRYRNRLNTKFVTLLVGLYVATITSATDNLPTTELLWVNGAPGALGNEPKDKPTLIIYRVMSANGQSATPAVVVCPGGGYGHLAMGHEGHDIANWLNSLGISAFVVDYRHRGSQRNLLGDSPDAALVESLSNEKQVSAETPPTFLFHVSEDDSVPAENSVAFYLALKKQGIPAEMHIYEQGRHGIGLASGMPRLSSWPARCADWMRGRQILPEK